VAPTEARGENYLLEVDNEVVVPVGKKVRMVLTANDVIHAWTIPAFAIKQDAIPGFVRDAWFKADKVGVYRGNCVELCGKDHAFMPIVVRVVSAEDYTAWVAGEKKKMAALADDPTKVWTIDELKTKGEAVYAANCVACHQANGKGVPNTFAPLDGSPVVNGAKAHQVEVLLTARIRRLCGGHAGLEAVVGFGHRRGDHLYPQYLVEQGRRKHRPTGRSAGCTQQVT
jgi:cytochrome c oxidase subunit 2